MADDESSLFSVVDYSQITGCTFGRAHFASEAQCEVELADAFIVSAIK